MKWLVRIAVLIIALPLLLFGSIMLASELGGEVVVLHREAVDGSVDEVRVWIVDDENGTWIEHGDPTDHWIRKLADDPSLTIERDGVARAYRASADPDSCAVYNRLRDAKYGLADRYVDLFAPDSISCTPIRLTR